MTAGLRISGMLSERAGFKFGAGVEHDLQTCTNAYAGTSAITGLKSFALAADGVTNRTRGVGSVGAFYQVDKNQRLTGNVSLRIQAFTSQNAVTAMAGYQLAF